MIFNLVFSKLIDLFKGNITKHLISHFYIPLVFPIFGLLLFFSWLNYPKPYILGSQAISNLGNPIRNPFPGWLLFSLAVWYLAFMLIPIFMFAYRKLKIIYPRLALIGTIVNFSAIIGMVFVGIFPNLSSTMIFHATGAIFAFGGLVTGAIIYWSILLKEAMVKGFKHRTMIELVALLLIFLLFIMILIIGIIQILAIKFGISFVSWYLEFPFWEWVLFLFTLIHLFLIDLLIPKKVIPIS